MDKAEQESELGDVTDEVDAIKGYLECQAVTLSAMITSLQEMASIDTGETDGAVQESLAQAVNLELVLDKAKHAIADRRLAACLQLVRDLQLKMVDLDLAYAPLRQSPSCIESNVEVEPLSPENGWQGIADAELWAKLRSRLWFSWSWFVVPESVHCAFLVPESVHCAFVVPNVCTEAGFRCLKSALWGLAVRYARPSLLHLLMRAVTPLATSAKQEQPKNTWRMLCFTLVLSTLSLLQPHLGTQSSFLCCAAWITTILFQSHYRMKMLFLKFILVATVAVFMVPRI